MEIARNSVSTVEWLEHVLHPWTSYLIVPLFALANAGIEVSTDSLRDALRVADHVGHPRRSARRQAAGRACWP